MSIKQKHSNTKSVRLIFISLLALACLWLEGRGDCQAREPAKFPAGTIKILVPASPGGSLGTEIRSMTPFLEKYLGVRTAVEYIGGAEGIIAYNKIYQEKPNGYTLIHSTFSSAIALELTRESAKYAVKNLSPVASWTAKNHSLLVHPESWKNFAGFLEDSRKRKLSVAGTGGSPDIQGRLMARSLGMELNWVPYASGGEGTAAVAGRHVDSIITYTVSARPMVRGGRLTALEVFAAKRDRLLPEVPSIWELGYDKVPLLLNLGVFLAPPQTPKAITDILERAVQKATADPAFLALAEKSGIVPDFKSAAETRKLILECYDLLNSHKDLVR